MKIAQVEDFYEKWYLDYASYVILERAIPHIKDGLKPVQRRILYSLFELDDGRLHKVIGVIGHCMKYHPHGDSSVYGAIVGLGQDNILIDTQGNWGDPMTGDRSAAGRYIEARISKMSKRVAFNHRLTEYRPSYDGRANEPVTLPMKFPLLLQQGADGIAVGLACTILPHNFVELCDAAIAHLEGREFTLYPDFPSGGIADIRGYNDGVRGGRVRVRSHIDIENERTLVIRSAPYKVTAPALMESIEAAMAQNKIKIDRIEDLTTKDFEITIKLPHGADAEMTRDALYAFTSCETSFATNACVIKDGKPIFIGISQIFRENIDQARHLIKKEIEMRLADLREDWQRMMLEYLFIENKIYQDFEKYGTHEELIDYTIKSMLPFRDKLLRDITDEDAVRLTEIKLVRISRFDAQRFPVNKQKNEDGQAKCLKDIEDLTALTIEYFKSIKKDHTKEVIGKKVIDRTRKTELAEFGVVHGAAVAVANVKLYVDKEEGFVGYGIKKGEPICECSDIDDVIAIGDTGWMKVLRIAPKSFIGKGILFAGIWRKVETRIFNVIYQDKESGNLYAKRFQSGAITRDRPYQLLKSEGSKVLFLGVQDAGTPPKVRIKLEKGSGPRNLDLEYDFSELAVKGREAGGNRISKGVAKTVIEIQK